MSISASWKHLLYSQLGRNHAKIRFKINNPGHDITFTSSSIIRTNSQDQAQDNALKRLAKLSSPAVKATAARPPSIQDWITWVQDPAINEKLSPSTLVRLFEGLVVKLKKQPNEQIEILLMEILKREHLARIINYDKFSVLLDRSERFINYIREFPELLPRFSSSTIAEYYSEANPKSQLSLLYIVEKLCTKPVLTTQQRFWVLEFLNHALTKAPIPKKDYSKFLPFIQELYDTRAKFARSALYSPALREILNTDASKASSSNDDTISTNRKYRF